jgi:hypothetical protein
MSEVKVNKLSPRSGTTVTLGGTNTRISLAFNTFYKGSVGSNTQLTELIL